MASSHKRRQYRHNTLHLAAAAAAAAAAAQWQGNVHHFNVSSAA